MSSLLHTRGKKCNFSGCFGDHIRKAHAEQLSIVFQLLIKTKMLEIENFLCVKVLNVAFILLINLKMPTNDGNLTDNNLTFMSRINLV